MAKAINVYINGTDESSDLGGYVTSLANVLHAMTEQTDQQESICLEGCAINNSDIRDLGAIFTFHLEAQINELVKKIRNKLSSEQGKITLNLYGFSRGGAAVFWMCEKLKDVSPDKLEINVCSLEPVPGNFIRGSYVDNVTGFKSTLSGIIADLSDCKNINKMLVLFTNKPLPDIACHGPILPIKPSQAEMRVDALPGCHKNAELFTVSQNGDLSAYSDYSAITFHYVTRFLKECGTRFNESRFNYDASLRPDSDLTNLLDSEKKRIRKDNRSMHFYNEIRSNPGKKYLNLFHKELVTKEKTNDSSDCVLSIKDPNPEPNYWNGQKSNGYFPMFAAGAGIVAAFYRSPILGAVATAGTAGYYAKNRYKR